MSGWHNSPRTIRKIVVALTPDMLDKKIEGHEERGWIRKSEIQPHRDGMGILMEFPNRQMNEVIPKVKQRLAK